LRLADHSVHFTGACRNSGNDQGKGGGKMDLKSFFDHFLEENELVRAGLMSDESFDSIGALAEFKTESIADRDILAEVAGHISMGGAALVRDLVDIDPADNLHHIDYEVRKSGPLIDYQYIREEGMAPASSIMTSSWQS